MEFLKKYVPIDLDDYIGVINVPGDDKPYGRMYAIQDSDQIPERRNLYLNVPMEELKGYVIDSLKDGEPVLVRLRRAAALRPQRRCHGLRSVRP